MILHNLVETMRAHGCRIREIIEHDGVDKIVDGQMRRFTALDLIDAFEADETEARKLKARYAERKGQLLTQPAPEGEHE